MYRHVIFKILEEKTCILYTIFLNVTIKIGINKNEKEIKDERRKSGQGYREGGREGGRGGEGEGEGEGRRVEGKGRRGMRERGEVGMVEGEGKREDRRRGKEGG